jgi:hypothetical protein
MDAAELGNDSGSLLADGNRRILSLLEGRSQTTTETADGLGGSFPQP